MHRSYATALAALLLAALLSGCFCKATPREQKLANCTTNALSFRVAWPTGELFNIVLGVPYSDTNALAFRGELVFSQSTGIVARVQISAIAARNAVRKTEWSENIEWILLT